MNAKSEVDQIHHKTRCKSIIKLITDVIQFLLEVLSPAVGSLSKAVVPLTEAIYHFGSVPSCQYQSWEDDRGTQVPR